MGTLSDYTLDGKSLVREGFVETGTYLGATLAKALAAGFADLRSVEVNETHYRNAVARFAGEPRVRLYHGSSPDVLPDMLDADRPTTVWLDAHYQGQGGGAELDRKYGQCPLLAELRAVFAVAWREPPVVLIDDSFFLLPFDRWSPEMKARYDFEQWPRRRDVEALLPAGYTTVDRNCVLYCLPPGW